MFSLVSYYIVFSRALGGVRVCVLVCLWWGSLTPFDSRVDLAWPHTAIMSQSPRTHYCLHSNIVMSRLGYVTSLLTVHLGSLLYLVSFYTFKTHFNSYQVDYGGIWYLIPCLCPETLDDTCVSCKHVFNSTLSSKRNKLFSHFTYLNISSNPLLLQRQTPNKSNNSITKHNGEIRSTYELDIESAFTEFIRIWS